MLMRSVNVCSSCAWNYSYSVALCSSARPKKGFGQNGKSPEVQGKKSDLKLLKEAENDLKTKRTRKLWVDPEEAARGKVDFVKVESWGTGDNADLEQLKLKSFSPSASSFGSDMPFYEQLVKRIQLLESKGDISVVQPKPLPSFERWKFREKRYVQYLVDQLAVYEAIEDAVAKNAEAEYVAVFAQDFGLDRSSAIRGDLSAMRVDSLPEPTTQTTAYVKYIQQLSTTAVSDSSKGTKESLLRLVAHIFGVHVSHLSTGMRIGAKAVECLPVLAERKAFSFYHAYPEGMKDPLKVLIAALNRLGGILEAEEDREEVMQELPKAITKTSLLLSTIAVEE